MKGIQMMSVAIALLMPQISNAQNTKRDCPNAYQQYGYFADGSLQCSLLGDNAAKQKLGAVLDNECQSLPGDQMKRNLAIGASKFDAELQAAGAAKTCAALKTKMDNFGEQ